MSGRRRLLRRSLSAGAAGLLAAMVAACSGVGGGYLPPDPTAGFTGQASFGFTFSCQDRGGLNPQPGKLSIQLEYLDHGTSLFLGAPFSVHGTVDQIPPVLESEVCSGPNPPLVPGQLAFLGRFRPNSTPPPGFPSTCPSRETKTAPLCRFEVDVQDNDGNLAPSQGDFFSIQLSNDTTLCTGPNVPAGYCSTLGGTIFYTRAGVLQGGNITVK